MSTAAITIHTKPDVKAKTRTLAKKKGLSVSGLLNLVLQKVISDKSFVAELSEEPSPYLLKSIKRGRKSLKEGKTSPIFHTAREGIEYLHK